MSTRRILRTFGAGLLLGLRFALLYLVVWPVWSVVTALVWFASIFTGALFALLVILCPGDRLQAELIKLSPFWFSKD